ncbi:hypothetical protein HYH96_17220 [Clostridium botulinum]|uniref:Lipoprotein n=3 Tax=Clostridium TaxID=1485 RepID=A0A6M0SZD2_CLOBO|nr:MULTISPECIES: hypothetical protein [Clostridium]ACA47001.1 putative lipoprotein [Clostridium botulinum B1 str. Okra]ACA57296.1 putative lipoprotein [Clostridium botulinum A3 str. Loch Maree]APF25224.1 putative lipoprotein [Clostridium sporogenes]APH14878.1 putative lipoprotein [Clostridium sporogenes]APR02852.1 putative lipoprotein [Clostridium botulinum]
MKKNIFLILILSLLLCACEGEVNQPIEEQPVLYYKTIKVVVVSNKKTTWYAGTRWYKQKIKVKSKEYNIQKEFYLTDSGAFASMPYWNCKEGDMIAAELYSWKKESTEEIVKREINQLK